MLPSSTVHTFALPWYRQTGMRPDNLCCQTQNSLDLNSAATPWQDAGQHIKAGCPKLAGQNSAESLLQGHQSPVHAVKRSHIPTFPTRPKSTNGLEMHCKVQDGSRRDHGWLRCRQIGLQTLGYRRITSTAGLTSQAPGCGWMAGPHFGAHVKQPFGFGRFEQHRRYAVFGGIRIGVGVSESKTAKRYHYEHGGCSTRGGMLTYIGTAQRRCSKCWCVEALAVY